MQTIAFERMRWTSSAMMNAPTLRVVSVMSKSEFHSSTDSHYI